MSEHQSPTRHDDPLGHVPAPRRIGAGAPGRASEADGWDFTSIHPDPETAREVVIDTLLGALAEAAGGLTRALDFRAATPEGLAMKHDVRHALANAEKALAWRAPGPERWATPAGQCPSCGAADQPKCGECSKCGNHCFPRRSLMATSRDLAADLAMLMRYVANLRREADRADVLLAASEAGIPVDTRPPEKPLRALAAEHRDVAEAIAHVAGVAAQPRSV